MADLELCSRLLTLGPPPSETGGIEVQSFYPDIGVSSKSSGPLNMLLQK